MESVQEEASKPKRDGHVTAVLFWDDCHEWEFRQVVVGESKKFHLVGASCPVHIHCCRLAGKFPYVKKYI